MFPLLDLGNVADHYYHVFACRFSIRKNNFPTTSDRRPELARISHSPPAAIAYLMPSPGLVLIADFDPPSADLHPAHYDKPRICHNLRDFAAKFVRNPGWQPNQSIRASLSVGVNTCFERTPAGGI